MVGHQHVGVQPAVAGQQGFAQQLAVAGAVIVVQEAGQSAVAALHHVLRDAGEGDAGLAGHVGSLARAAPMAHRRTQALRIGGCAEPMSEVNLTPFLRQLVAPYLRGSCAGFTYLICQGPTLVSWTMVSPCAIAKWTMPGGIAV